MIRRLLAQTRVEIVLTLRRGESLLVTLVIPAAVLLFFSAVDVVPHPTRRAVDFLVPGVMALAVVSTGLVSLGIATAFERQAGVLRRLAATPLGRGGLIGAKLSALAIMLALQIVVLGGLGLALDWRLRGSAAAAVLVLVLGAIAFGSLGLLMAGTLRAETTLAVANGAFLVLLLTAGFVVPLERLPDGVQTISRVLPAEPLAASLRAALEDGRVPLARVLVLAAWALGASVVAARSLRWD